MDHPGDNAIVACEEILFRAILKKRHIADGKPDAGAFLLGPNDDGKLSTFRKKIVTQADVKAQFKSCPGVVTLHTGHVRAIGNDRHLVIDVVADEPPLGHASILNLPDPGRDRFFAEWIASNLRDQSRPAIE
jgi:hypothetical protein